MQLVKKTSQITSSAFISTVAKLSFLHSIFARVYVKKSHKYKKNQLSAIEDNA